MNALPNGLKSQAIVLAIVIASLVPASAASDLIQGANATSAVAQPSPAGQLSQSDRRKLQTTIRAAHNLRLRLSTDINGLRAAFTSDEEKAALGSLAAEDSGSILTLWHYFFRGSIVAVGHGLSDAPRIGFYNPMADAWAIADLKRVQEGDLDLQSFSIISGDQMIGRTRQDDPAVPHWTQRQSLPLPTALSFATAANLAAFDKQNLTLSSTMPKPLSSPNERGVVLARLQFLVITVSTFNEDPPYRQLAAQVQAAVKNGSGSALAQLTSAPNAQHHRLLRRVGLLSQPVRESFHVVGTFRHANGMTVALSSPFSGKWVLFADLDTSTSGQPKLDHLLALDLGQLN